jgi:hypothetical protein
MHIVVDRSQLRRAPVGLCVCAETVTLIPPLLPIVLVLDNPRAFIPDSLCSVLALTAVTLSTRPT